MAVLLFNHLKEKTVTCQTAHWMSCSQKHYCCYYKHLLLLLMGAAVVISSVNRPGFIHACGIHSVI